VYFLTPITTAKPLIALKTKKLQFWIRNKTYLADTSAEFFVVLLEFSDFALSKIGSWAVKSVGRPVRNRSRLEKTYLSGTSNSLFQYLVGYFHIPIFTKIARHKS
jgi:hypothetical protein